MRRLIVLTAVAAMALAIMPGTNAFAKNSHAKATGGVSWDNANGDELRASFNAHDDAPGAQSDRGEMDWRAPSGSTHVSIDCVRVEGDTAWFSGQVTRADGNFASRAGDYMFVRVHDGGTPGRKGDTFRATFRTSDPCGDVESMASPGDGFQVTKGNLKVH